MPISEYIPSQWCGTKQLNAKEKTMTTFTIFYKVPGQYLSSTTVEATSRESAIQTFNSQKRAGGMAIITSVMQGR